MKSAQHPDEPWLRNAEWASRRIGDTSRATTSALWGMSILWNGISWLIFLFIPEELEKGNYAILIGLIFPLLGLTMLISAIRGTLRGLRFHRSTFIMDTLPAPIGGVMRGRVEVPYEPLADATSIIIRLSAVQRRRSGKSMDESTVWQGDEEIARGAVSRMPDRVSIPIAIAIPADLPQTDVEGAERTIWRLAVDAEVPGVDYHAVFEVPVFRTGHAQSLQPQLPHTPPPEPREPESFVAKQTANGRELYFPPFRAPALAFMALLITAVWIVIVTAAFLMDVPFFFGIFFALAGIPLLFITLDLFFSAHTIVLGREQVVLRRRFFVSKEHDVRRAEMALVEAKIGSEISGTAGRTYYDVHVRTREGKKIAAAKYIRSKREAEWVAAQIRGAVDSRP